MVLGSGAKESSLPDAITEENGQMERFPSSASGPASLKSLYKKETNALGILMLSSPFQLMFTHCLHTFRPTRCSAPDFMLIPSERGTLLVANLFPRKIPQIVPDTQPQAPLAICPSLPI